MVVLRRGYSSFIAIPSIQMAEGIVFQNWAQARPLRFYSNPADGPGTTTVQSVDQMGE